MSTVPTSVVAMVDPKASDSDRSAWSQTRSISQRYKMQVPVWRPLMLDWCSYTDPSSSRSDGRDLYPPARLSESAGLLAVGAELVVHGGDLRYTVTGSGSPTFISGQPLRICPCGRFDQFEEHAQRPALAELITTVITDTLPRTTEGSTTEAPSSHAGPH
jgi:hypothetical protein